MLMIDIYDLRVILYGGLYLVNIKNHYVKLLFSYYDKIKG